jgi:hypothetical protein
MGMGVRKEIMGKGKGQTLLKHLQVTKVRRKEGNQQR